MTCSSKLLKRWDVPFEGYMIVKEDIETTTMKLCKVLQKVINCINVKIDVLIPTICLIRDTRLLFEIFQELHFVYCNGLTNTDIDIIARGTHKDVRNVI